MTGVIGPEYAGPAMIAVTSALGAFSTFLPPLTDVRNASEHSDFAGDVRTGEVAASVLTIGIGAVAASIVGNAVPLAISIMAAAALVAIYEWTLRGKPFAHHAHNSPPAFALLHTTPSPEGTTNV